MPSRAVQAPRPWTLRRWRTPATTTGGELLHRTPVAGRAALNPFGVARPATHNRDRLNARRFPWLRPGRQAVAGVAPGEIRCPGRDTTHTTKDGPMNHAGLLSLSSLLALSIVSHARSLHSHVRSQRVGGYPPRPAPRPGRDLVPASARITRETAVRTHIRISRTRIRILRLLESVPFGLKFAGGVHR